MKKYFVIMLTVVTIAMLSGCAGREISSSSTRSQWIKPVGPNGEAAIVTHQSETYSVTEGGVTRTWGNVTDISEPVQMVPMERPVYYPSTSGSLYVGATGGSWARWISGGGHHRHHGNHKN